MKKIIYLLVLVMALVFSSWTGSEAQADLQQQLEAMGALPNEITVMTRNIYVGANLDIIMAAEDATQIPILAAEAFAAMQATNFPERAQALADEIAWTRPHLIGIQEASLIRMQENGDLVGGGTTPAETVVYDYLKILRKTLRQNNLNYKLAVKGMNFDVEVPMVNPDSSTGFSDVRLTDFDVILAHKDVKISRKTVAKFQTILQLPTLGVDVPRGFVAVDATFKGRTYRFVNTHLEPVMVPELLPLQMAQAQELVAALQDVTLPVILVGDFNSKATKGESYKLIKSTGSFVDAWTRNLYKLFITHNKRGFTNPHDDDLLNTRVKLNQRIDLIFVRSNVWAAGYHDIGPVVAVTVGDHLDDRTASGLWPSDHAGVAAILWIPEGP
jgi:endonuclease/exonuclease/phosphatase family metal-dependent hydrolase